MKGVSASEDSADTVVYPACDWDYPGTLAHSGAVIRGYLGLIFGATFAPLLDKILDTLERATERRWGA